MIILNKEINRLLAMTHGRMIVENLQLEEDHLVIRLCEAHE